MENKIKIEIKSNKDYLYEVEIFGKTFLNIHIKDKGKAHKLYKNLIFDKINLERQKLDFSELIKLIKENNKLLKLKENKYNLTLIIELPKPYSSSIKIFFELLNIEYYLTQGPFYKRINKNPFFASLNINVYNLQIIKEILKREKIINKYNIDNYRYYDEKKKGFIKIDELKYYDTPPNKLILELHFNKYIDPVKFQYENFDNDIINKIIKMKNEIKFTLNLFIYIPYNYKER